MYSENSENVKDKFDNNPFLLGFNNGLFDFNKNIFRNTSCNDYISMSVGYNYEKINLEKMNKLIHFFEDLQPNKIMRDNLLTYLSTCLIGRHYLQDFVILTSSYGRYGKLKLSELLFYTFGDYYSSINSKMLTKQSTDISILDQTILKIYKKRIIIALNIEKKDKLNTTYIKCLTDTDKINIRLYNSNIIIELRINFKIIMLSNDIPDINDPNDNSYFRRVKYINFPIQFIDNPIESYQKKIDYNLNVDELKNEFMHLLIKYYNNYTYNMLTSLQYYD